MRQFCEPRIQLGDSVADSDVIDYLAGYAEALADRQTDGCTEE